MLVQETVKLLLWVDDSDVVEDAIMSFLAVRGIVMLKANSTHRALKILQRAEPDWIVTNLARCEARGMHPQAGLDLVASVRQAGITTPLAIYAATIPEADGKSALEKGANLIAERWPDLRTWMIQRP
jgi:CheY-like chemotaxis protein